MEAASTRTKQPRKSILKKASEHHEDKHKGASFDEMNILATYHPPGKDYGHMKIDEPKTPYRNDSEGEDVVDPEDISKRLADATDPRVCRPRHDSGQSDDGDGFLTVEEQEKRKQFTEARKKHYNMKDQLQNAKELLAKEMAELEDD